MSFTTVLDIHVHVIHITAMMTQLDTFMKANGMRDRALADRVNCHRSMVTKLRHGTATPSPALAAKIENETGIDARVLLGIPAKRRVLNAAA